MQRIQILTFFLLASLQSIGQFSLETNMILGGNSVDEAKDIDVNPSNTAVFFGARTFSSDGDVPGNAGGSDFWIVKRNMDGSPIWSKNFGGPGNDDLTTVMAHSDGGVLGFGTTRTNQGAFGTIIGLAGGWLMRTNTNGSIIDGKIFGGNITETAVDAFRHTSGNVTMALESGSAMLNGQTNNGVLDVWIVHVNSTFNIQWTALLGGSGTDVPEAITSDINGNIYICATSNSNLPGLDTNKGGKDVWIIKLDPNGQVLWQKTFGGAEDDESTDILFHPDGFVYVLAQSQSADGDFDTNHGLNDQWLIKLDQLDGDLLRMVRYGGSGNDFGGHLDTYGDDHLVFSISTTSSDLDLTGNKGFGDVWIVNTDLNGTLTQQMNYGGSLNDLAVDILTVDSVFHVLSSSLSIDKNVPNNAISQQDLWYFTLNTRPDSCSQFYKCEQDSSSSNHLFPPSTDVLICVSGCTPGYGPGPNFNTGTCPDFNNATSYFYLSTDANVDLLTISVSSNDFNQPQIALLKTVNCVSFQQIECAIGTNGFVLIPYIDVDPLATYVIAVSDAEGNIGQYELCATAIEVEFCNEEDRIYVINTSLGSPLNGPYKPAEEVQFCYELEDWNKLDCNGFQGLVPTFGPGWDTTWFDLFGQPIQIDSMLIPVEQGFWAWYKVGDVRYNVSNPINGYVGGQGMPPGWYFTNTGDPPPTENPDQTTGDINTCLPTPDKWKICFTLRVVDDCETNLDCSVTMKTFSDGELGINTSLGCAYDQEEIFTAFMQCCLNPNMSTIQDFSICSGDTISFEPETNLLPPVTYTWTHDPDPFITGTTSGNEANRFFQVIETDAAIPLGVRYSILAEGNGCITETQEFEVTVLPLPSSQISISGPNIVCSGSTVTLNFVSTGTPPFAIGLYKDNEFFANVLSESSSLSINIDPVFTGRFRIGTLSDANCDGQGTGFVNVTVKPVGSTVIDTSLCEGESITVGPNVYTEAGNYTIVLEEAAENNCDSIINLSLSISPTITEIIDEVICHGDTLFVLDVPYTETTNEIIEYVGPTGCPNFIDLRLLVQDTFSMDINQTICNGDTLDFEGILVYQAGSYAHVEEVRPGCYEETILNLNVLPAITINDLAIIGDNGFNNGAIIVEIIGGSPPFAYLWSSGPTTESLFNIAFGDYSLTVTDRLGCDQVFHFEVPMINATNEPGEEHTFINVRPTLTKSGSMIQIFNADSNPTSIISADWWTFDGRKRKAGKEIAIAAGAASEIKVPDDFTPGVYFLQLSLDNKENNWVKIVVQ